MQLDDTHEGPGDFARATARGLEEGDSAKPRYLQYQRDLIAPHCGRSVLEVGTGLGDFAAGFTTAERLILTDSDPGAVNVMKKRFGDRPEVETRIFDCPGELPLGRPVDTVVAINVLEHMEDDVGTLQAMARLVAPGGTVVLWVPAYQQLYGDFDRKVGHVQRYTPATIRAAGKRAGLTVTVARPVNLLGGVAWWLAVRKGGSGSPKPGLVSTYDQLVVPATRAMEKVARMPFGQSVLCVARKPADA